jgi:hypothetical protein
VNRQQSHLWAKAWAFRQGPAFELAVEFEPEIVVEPDGVVLGSRNCRAPGSVRLLRFAAQDDSEG